MITGKHLARRTLLRGLGASIALPLLDSMTPAFAATAGGNAPRRMAFVYVPNGIIMKHWTPTAAGTDFEFTRILKPLEPYREKLMVLSGLTHNTGRALGDGPGDHARAAATFLTGVHPKKTAGADIHAGISVDQIAAKKMGNTTRLASLELGCEDGRLVGNCDSGYSCAYSNSISWRTTATPMPPEVNPRAAFERLFGDASETPEARAKRLRYNKSILDFVSEDTQRLKGDLGKTDRRKLDEYLDAVREIERRIEMAERDAREFTPSMEKPAGVPVEFADHVKLMFDLMTLAFQADVTRISTFIICREGSTRTYREIGVNDAHHPLTHHRNNPEWIEKVAKINCLHLEQFAYFVDKLKSTPDGDGTLLDRVLVVYGSGLADGNQHTHNDLPVLLAGAGNGALRPGRHLRYPKETPMTNLYVAMLDHMGIPPEQIGDSTGELEHLTDLS
jgi:hypothetical protein